MERNIVQRNLEEMYKANELASDFFHSCLTRTTYGKPAREYLASRGVTEQAIAEYKLGFAPPDWNKLSTALMGRGFSADALVRAGLAAVRSKGEGIFDRFRARIMFPITDGCDRVIGFGGRAIDRSEEVKYLNTPETPIFNKRYVLYGFERAMPRIRETGRVVVVEGFLDLVTTQSVAVPNAAASLGTAFTPEQAKRLARYASEIYFAYDSDAAGQNATIRAMATVQEMGLDVRVVHIPDGKDPDEFIRKNGPKAFKALLARARTFAEAREKTAV